MSPAGKRGSCLGALVLRVFTVPPMVGDRHARVPRGVTMGRRTCLQQDCALTMARERTDPCGVKRLLAEPLDCSPAVLLITQPPGLTE